MNARSYRINLRLSPLDFPEMMWLGESTVSYQSEPRIDKKNVVLTITKKFALTDMNTRRKHDFLTVKSDYEIPFNLIRSREDVYEFYKDATQSLSEAYQYARTQLPTLPNIPFPYQPIESYKGEIDRVFQLLNSQN